MRSRALALLLGALLSVPGTAMARSDVGIKIRRADLSPDGRVALVVSVRGTDGSVIPAERFKVMEERDAIQSFEVTPLIESSLQAVAVALVIDVSGSTKGPPLNDAKQAAKTFLRGLPPQVLVEVIAFDSEASVQNGFTTDRAALIATIDSLVAARETALYDAIALAASTFAGVPDHQHNMVVFSDGKDTASRSTLDQAVQAAVQNASPVTSVGLVTSEYDPAALSTLASATGGKSFDVTRSDQLASAFSQVAREIASQYVVTYTAKRVDPKDLELLVSVEIEGGTATDKIVTSNPRIFEANGSEPEPYIPPRPNRIYGLGLWLGLAAAFIALVLIQSGVIKPAGNRALRLISTASRSADSSRGPTLAATSRLAVRAVDLVDHVPKPKGYEEGLQLSLDRAGWPLRASEFLVLRIVSAAGGALMGVGLLGRASLAAALMIIGGWVPKLILNVRVERRRSAFLTQLPDTLQLLAGSLQAGYGLRQAMDTVAREAGPPASTEFGRVLAESRLGMPLEEALDRTAQRVGSEDFRWVVMAINIQRQSGGNLAALLATVAGTLREREQLRRQIKVLSAEGRLSAWVLGILPFLIAGYLTLVNPTYIGTLMNHPTGRAMVAIALALMIAGVLWMKRLIRIEV